jgi:hypothetical protein
VKSSRWPSKDMNLGRTDRAFKDFLVASGNASGKLQYRFEAALITGCTYAMKFFGRLSVRFQNVSERWAATHRGLQFIALLLNIPCFKASHFFFKVAYAIQQRRLRLACGEDLFLKFYDRRIATGGVVDVLQSLRNIERGLKGAEASENFPHHDGPSRNGLETIITCLKNSFGCPKSFYESGVIRQSPSGERETAVVACVTLLLTLVPIAVTV